MVPPRPHLLGRAALLCCLTAAASASSSAFLTSFPKAAASASGRRSSLLSSVASDAIPVTFLSGFLGSGKTTTLKHLLENASGARIGVVVNDVAAVNIDAKLVASSLDAEGNAAAVSSGSAATVELRNGCVCCSLADELMDAVGALAEGRAVDHVVVEMSGVANPYASIAKWNEAAAAGHVATKAARLQQVVTVVDAATFGTNWMTFDAAGDRDGWTEKGDECTASKKIPELLADQIDGANTVLMNKVDIAGEKRVREATQIVKAMNAEARVHTVAFGKVDVSEILRTDAAAPKKSCCADPTCEKPDCDAPPPESTGGDSSKSPSSCGGSSKSPSSCGGSSKSPSSCGGSSKSKSCCDDPACDAPDRDGPPPSPCCDDPACDAPSRSRATKPAADLGISSFVYRAARPFHTQRLLGTLSTWPVPTKEDLDLSQIASSAAEGAEMTKNGVTYTENSPFAGVLRSKGYCWMAPMQWNGKDQDVWRHDQAMYWSHAGKQFSIDTSGKWWGTQTKDAVRAILANDPKEFERLMAEDWVTEEFGDRRQELVFIGVGLDEERICKNLDGCLLSAEEMDVYRQNARTLLDV